MSISKQFQFEFDDLQNAMTNKGWATEIDLNQFSGGQQGDKLVLNSVDLEDLDEGSFIL